jgi:hypothetical protein
VGKTSSFVFAAILGIAFFVSLGSTSPISCARADDIDDSDQLLLDRADYDAEHPRYQLAPSRWSMGLRAALDSFPVNSGVGNSYQFFGEWILPFQKSGLFSFGAHFGTIPLNNGSHNAYPVYIPYPNYLSMMGGLQARYQFRYFLNQFLVPTVAAEWDYYRIILSGDRTEDAIGSAIGINAGLMFNLGVIDRDTARQSYTSLSLTRAYLTFEIHPLQITAKNISLSGNFFYSGLRLEFE